MKQKGSTTGWVIAIIVIVIIVIIWIVADHSSNNAAVNGQSSTTTSTTLAGDVSTSTLLSTVHVLYGDAFTLNNGQASITGHSFSATSTPLVPVGYTLAATAFGEIKGSPASEGAVSVLYRNFGADIQQVAVFGFVDVNGTLEQVASGVVYTGDTQVQSVTIDQGIITISMLVVSPADLANLPHSAQKPTQPVLMKLQISGSSFVQAH